MQGAWMNVLINAQGLDDKEWATQITEKAESIFKIAESACNEIILDVQQRLKGKDQ
jgi:formiminotetrahydrofolate cyclodeaminase